MIPQVSKLTLLLSLCYKTEKEKIETKKKEVNNKASEMQKRIEQILMEQTEKFKENVNQMHKIDTTFNNNFSQQIVEKRIGSLEAEDDHAKLFEKLTLGEGAL